jgi:hypothetical protein
MLKKSLIFGGSALMLAALFALAACEGPMGPAGSDGSTGTDGVDGTNGTDGADGTDGTNGINGAPGGGSAGGPGGPGPKGDDGPGGGVVLLTGTVSDTDLEAAFAATETAVVLGAGVTSVYGEVPAGKTLRVLGDTAVENGEILTLKGGLVLSSDSAALRADMIGSASGGLAVDGGTISGSGKLYLPVDTDGTASGYATYQDVVFANKEVGSTVATGTVTDFSTPSAADVEFVFGLADGPDAITVANLTNIESATIPVGKTLTITGAASLVTGAGTFDPAGTLINEGTISSDTTAEAVLRSLVDVGGAIEVSGAVTTITAAFEVPEDVDLTLSGASTFAGAFDVTVEGTLTLGSSVVGFVPEGDVIVTGSLVLESSSVITIADTKALSVTGTVSGGGKIIAQGSGSTEGVLTIGGVDYTTTAGGVAGGDLADAATAIAASTTTLTDKPGINLDGTFGADVSGIGSVTLSGSSPTAVQNTANGSSDDNVEVSTGISLAGLTAIADGGGTAALTYGNFALTIETGIEVSIADSGYSGGTQDYGILEISGVQLQHSNLIGPELAPFHIGVLTEH